MAEITAALVKELRDRTGAGMMDCKKALAETNGDIEASIDWLRTKGLAAAAKKAGRVAAEGLVGVATDGTRGAVVEVNSETDFVAKNEQFQGFVRDVTQVALAGNVTDIDALGAAAYPSGGPVAEALRRGLGGAAKKAGRGAAEGLVGVATDGTRGAVVEVNSETDFVAKNEQFQGFVRDVTQVALAGNVTDIDALGAAAYPSGGTVAEALTQNIATIGENQSLRRAAILSVGSGEIGRAACRERVCQYV